MGKGREALWGMAYAYGSFATWMVGSAALGAPTNVATLATDLVVGPFVMLVFPLLGASMVPGVGAAIVLWLGVVAAGAVLIPVRFFRYFVLAVLLAWGAMCAQVIEAFASV